MTESHLYNPEGGLVAVLPPEATPEDILRSAYNLGPGDMLAAAADGPDWSLVIFLTEDRPTGDITRSLDVSLKEGSVALDQIETCLMELAVLDLWDRGWRLDRQS